MKPYQKTTIETYNKVAKSYQAKRDALILGPEIEKFEKLLSGKKILDVGCGPGRDARTFAEHGYDVTGIDLSEEFVKIARQNVQEAKFYLMDILDLEFEDNFFNGVWAHAVLLHLKRQDIPTALSEIHRVLKSSGIFFTSVKEGKGEETVPEKEFSGVPRFFSYFSKSEIEDYVKTAGFQILESYIYNERARFGPKFRDVNFVFTFSRK